MTIHHCLPKKTHPGGVTSTTPRGVKPLNLEFSTPLLHQQDGESCEPSLAQLIPTLGYKAGAPRQPMPGLSNHVGALQRDRWCAFAASGVG
jgi:hypothetical protein